MKILYLDCGMGAAGDMLAAALLELLPDPAGFVERLNGLGLPDVTFSREKSVKCGIAGTHLAVSVAGQEEGASHGHSSHAHNDLHGIRHLVQGHLDLPEAVREDILAVYDRLAQAESRVHGVPVEQIHFHEVGTLDAVADITAVCLLIHTLAPERILASPVRVGSGQVRCAHGLLPVPAPATAVLLQGIPIYAGEIAGELCTPTGAALLKHFVSQFAEMPLMQVQAAGYGMGKKDFPAANCVRALLGRTEEEAEQAVCQLACNLDDMTPEALAFACERLLELGALDVYTVAGTMKKGRAGHVLTVLCETDKEETIARHILAETTTNGLRVRRCEKYFLTPGMETVQTKWGNIRVKTAAGYGVAHAKPEYEDVARCAREAAVPYGKVWEAAAQKIERADGQEEA